MLDFTLDNISSEDVARLRALYEPLAQSVRELIDATIRTEADADVVATAKSEIDSATARLRATRLGNLHAEATTTRVEGVKTFAAGHLADDEGVTVEAEGVFILPRWPGRTRIRLR